MDQAALFAELTRLPVARRRLAIVVGRDKRLGRAAQGFIRHCAS